MANGLSDHTVNTPTYQECPEGYKPALRCERCGHFLLPHDVKGHERWHEEPRR